MQWLTGRSAGGLPGSELRPRDRRLGPVPDARPGARRGPAPADVRARGLGRTGGRFADARCRPVRPDHARGDGRRVDPEAARRRLEPGTAPAGSLRALRDGVASGRGRVSRAHAGGRRPPAARLGMLGSIGHCDRSHRYRPCALPLGDLQGPPRHRPCRFAAPQRPDAVAGRRGVGKRARRHRDRESGPSPGSAGGLCRRGRARDGRVRT